MQGLNTQATNSTITGLSSLGDAKDTKETPKAQMSSASLPADPQISAGWVCPGCEEHVATLSCVQCQAVYCDKCFSEAHKFKQLRMHERVALLA